MLHRKLYITIIDDKIIGYGTLTQLLDTIGSRKKYQTVLKNIKETGKTQVDEVTIRQIPIIRKSKNT